MSFTISGVVLRDPNFGDTEALVVKLHTHRTMTGVKHTYVSKPFGDSASIPEKKLKYIFSNITHLKYTELLAVLDAAVNIISITDHEGVDWFVWVLSVQTSFVLEGRKISETDFNNQSCVTYSDYADTELGTITLEFEGYEDV